MFTRSSRTTSGALAAALCAALLAPSLPAVADDVDAGDPAGAADPGVARISVVHGDVSVRRADSEDAFAAAVNAPVAAGDEIVTQGDGRGEIEFDYGSALRVAPATQLRFTLLEPGRHQLQVAAGTVDLRLFRGLASHPEIETPAATIRPVTNGSYRVTVTDDGSTEVTARSGRVNVVTSAGTQTIEPGPTLLVTGSADAADVATVDPVALDAFDAFNRSRDAAVERADDWAYVDAGFVGAEDLDAYGTWTDVDGYGRVWQPAYQSAGWAPYTTGRWVWQPYYGWAWVDDAPWGYAPYHYGRWFYANAGWYWAPGVATLGPAYYNAPVVYVPHPVYYRPALVAFFSFGGGGGFGFGFGNIGWCALAPAEVYRPWYGRGYATTYGESTNLSVNVNINVGRTYRNANAPGGAVAVNNGNFASGNFRTIVRLRPSDLTSVSAVHGVLPVVPTRANLAFSGHAGAGAAAPSTPLVTRFGRFTKTPKLTSPSFTVQQRDVTTAAVETYPGHAALFTHPTTQTLYDRPGLITNANAPDVFKAGTTVHSATPTGGTYGHGTTPATAASSNPADPFARFGHSSLMPEPTAPPTTDVRKRPLPAYAATPPPSYATPSDRTPGTYHAIGTSHTPFPASTTRPYDTPGTYRATGTSYPTHPAYVTPPYQTPGAYRAIATPHPYGAPTSTDTATYHPVKHPTHAPHPSPSPR